jgi:hypothetical protein
MVDPEEHMRTLTLALLLLLTGCPGGDSSFDFSKQPHLDTIPPAVGRWFEQPQVVVVDPALYPSPDWTGAVPADIMPLALVDADGALDSAVNWLKPHGLMYSRGAAGTITVKFYYGPWSSSKSVSGAVEVVEKATSAASVPPRRTSDYSGLTQIVASNKHHKSAVCWINVYCYADFKAQQAANPKIPMDWKASGRGVTQRIVWHELMHTVGLNDDPTGAGPGLMVYRSMAQPPNAQETDVIDWLYGD